MGRSISSIHKLAAATLDVQDCTLFPPKILWPTDIEWTKNEVQLALVESFVSVLENYLGVKKTVFSFSEKWAETRPAAANGMALGEYMNRASVPDPHRKNSND